MMKKPTALQPATERIEFATLYGTIIPREAGAPFAPYVLRDLGVWQGRAVPAHIGKLLRELSRRGRHGVSLNKVDPDDLAELALIGVPFKLTDWTKTNTYGAKHFVVIDAVLRFAEDGALVS